MITVIAYLLNLNFLRSRLHKIKTIHATTTKIKEKIDTQEKNINQKITVKIVSIC